MFNIKLDQTYNINWHWTKLMLNVQLKNSDQTNNINVHWTKLVLNVQLESLDQTNNINVHWTNWCSLFNKKIRKCLRLRL